MEKKKDLFSKIPWPLIGFEEEDKIMKRLFIRAINVQYRIIMSF